MKTSRLERIRNAKGEFSTRKDVTLQWMVVLLIIFILAGCVSTGIKYLKAEGFNQAYAEVTIVSPVAPSPTPIPKELITPTPTELEEVVAYITKKFEPEGKHVVVQAINCFYSESGLRPNAVGQNSDSHKSKDHGVAQLNDYWHKLTEAEKTDIKANIDRAYKIYKGRGNNFSAWYGKLCN